MLVYFYKVSYCDKCCMFQLVLSLKTIGLVGIVLGGRCPGVICPGGQLSLEDTVQVQLSGGNFPSWELTSG